MSEIYNAKRIKILKQDLRKKETLLEVETMYLAQQKERLDNALKLDASNYSYSQSLKYTELINNLKKDIKKSEKTIEKLGVLINGLHLVLSHH